VRHIANEDLFKAERLHVHLRELSEEATRHHFTMEKRRERSG
jgi:hypothetical protein